MYTHVFPIQLGITFPPDFHIFQRGWNNQPDIDDWVRQPRSIAMSVYVVVLCRIAKLLCSLYNLLVGGLEHLDYFSIQLRIIIPIDYIIFLEGFKPPTSIIYDHWWFVVEFPIHVYFVPEGSSQVTPWSTSLLRWVCLHL